MRRAVRWAIVAGALGVMAPASSRADDKATRDAQARFEEGLARVKSGDFEGARVSFAQAYAVLHKPDILWNLALSEQKSGHLVDALGHFKELGRLAASDGDRANAKKHVTELMAQTGHIDVQAPAGAQVAVDGKSIGVAPLGDAVDVFPGKHHVEAHMAQGAKTADADAVAGQVAHVSFMVADAPGQTTTAALTPSTPESNPGAGTNATPSPGGNAADGATPPSPDTTTPDSAGSSNKARIITVVAIGGVAVAAGALGLGFGLASSSNADTASTLRQQNPDCTGSTSAGCQQLQDTVSAQHDDAVLSKVFWISGGVLAAGAVATWFLWPKLAGSSNATSVNVVPMMGAGAAGAAAVGSF